MSVFDKLTFRVVPLLKEKVGRGGAVGGEGFAARRSWGWLVVSEQNFLRPFFTGVICWNTYSTTGSYFFDASNSV